MGDISHTVPSGGAGAAWRTGRRRPEQPSSRSCSLRSARARVLRYPQFRHSQAVKIGDRLELAGQGGWNDAREFPGSIAEEINQAFRNVDRSWSSLVRAGIT